MKLVIRRASVLQKGQGNGGIRTVTADSGVFKGATFSLGAPLKNSSQLDPAELIAIAHASSFSLTLSKELSLKASVVGEIVTMATVTLKQLVTGWTIMNIHLNVLARLPDMTHGRFIDATLRAKTRCLVSRSLCVRVSMNAKLEK